MHAEEEADEDGEELHREEVAEGEHERVELPRAQRLMRARLRVRVRVRV